MVWILAAARGTPEEEEEEVETHVEVLRAVVRAVVRVAVRAKVRVERRETPGRDLRGRIMRDDYGGG